MDFQARAQKLLQAHVQPWVDLLPWQATHPVHFDASEGYRGGGVLGCKAGPIESIAFDNLAHEMAHAIDIFSCGRMASLERVGWGLRIRTRVHIGGRAYEEPATMQASAREAEVSGIQLRLLELVGHPAVEGFPARQARTLARFMPDHIHGGRDDAERIATRERLIVEAYHHWPAARVQAAWLGVQPRLEALAQITLKQRLSTARNIAHAPR